MPAVQSTLVVHGFFQLCNPVRVESPRRTDPSTSTFHYQYDTALQCVDGTGLSAKLRFFSPPGDSPVPTATVCFVDAKVFITPHRGPVYLEGIRLAAVPGDPTRDDYQANVPDLSYGLIHGVGIVQDVSTDARPGENRQFRVQLQAWVRDDNKPCSIICVMPGTVARWRNIRLPHVNTGVYISGVCNHIRSNGMLEITLDDILFNLLVAPATDDESSSPSLPAPKRQKFDAMAFTHADDVAPVPSTSSVSSIQPPTIAHDSTLPTSPHDSVSSSQTARSMSPSHRSDHTQMHTYSTRAAEKRKMS